MARQAGRQHIAQRLERRFAPLFWLARTRLSWSDGMIEQTWDAADELDRLLERAGFGEDPGRGAYRSWQRKFRAGEKQNLYRRNSRLAARWDLPDNPVAKSIAAKWASSDDPMTRLNLAAANLTWLLNDLLVGLKKDHTAVGLLEALSTMDRRRRRDFLRWVQHRPFFKARLSLEGDRMALRPDPRDLRTCMWVLAAELIAGGWPVKRCMAPTCGRYIGQWTKRERLFCDEGCRTDYHNAQRAKLGKESYWATSIDRR
jgi:hypothetical protein